MAAMIAVDAFLGHITEVAPNLLGSYVLRDGA